MLMPDDAPGFAEHLARNAPTPGVGSPPISAPFSRNYKTDVPAQIKSAKRRWAIPAGEHSWERAWGVFADGKIVGEVTLSTSRLIETQLHRAILSMGIEPNYRGNGVGTALLAAALSWAKAQEFLTWIDLGVFAHNATARRLYEKFGFVETGRCIDCFRVDDVRVDDIQMVLNLKQHSDSAAYIAP